MKVLVTGASGFIGRNLLLSVPPNWDVTALYNTSRDFLDFLNSRSLGHVKPLRTDLSVLREAERVKRISDRFDVCVYLAANGDPALSVKDPTLDLTANTLTLVNLLQSVSFEKFVYLSSGAVYDGLKGAVSPSVNIDPRLPYAISKIASENYLRYFHRHGQLNDLVVVRFFGAYGPYEPPRKIYTKLVRRFAIEKDPRFTIRGDGRNLIDAMYVGDAIDALMLLVSKPVNVQILDLHHGTPFTLSQLVQQAARIFGLEPKISYEGSVPEYIEFFSQDDVMVRGHGFHPKVDLGDGLRKLYDHLLRFPGEEQKGGSK